MAQTISENRLRLLKNSYRKLDSMVLSFGLPVYSETISPEDFDRYIGGDLNDALREMKYTDCESINEMSTEEMYTEIRTVYYALRRFRLSSSVYFKFSTAVDGKTIDKSMIPKMLGNIIKEYNDDFIKWRRTGKIGSTGQTWNMPKG